MNSSVIKSKTLSQLVFLIGISIWITIITINNINDSGTNTFFIKEMLNMSLFDKNSIVGNHLLWRSMDIEWLPSLLLWCVVILEAIIDIFMWRAVIKCFKNFLNGEKISDTSLAAVNIALALFMILFMCFICGGMWFGYWMHQGPFQMVHLTSIILAVLGLIYHNQPSER